MQLNNNTVLGKKALLIDACSKYIHHPCNQQLTVFFLEIVRSALYSSTSTK